MPMFSEAQMRRIWAVVLEREAEQLAQAAVRLAPRPPIAAGVAPTLFFRVTSTTKVDDRYPAMLLAYDEDAKTWSDAENGDVWAVESTGGSLATGVRYLGRRYGYAGSPEYPVFVVDNDGGSAGSGITSLNGLTAATQTFAVGTSGTDFAVSSSTSTHTFNLPSASASNRGVVTIGTQSFAGVKSFIDDITYLANNGSSALKSSAVTFGHQFMFEAISGETPAIGLYDSNSISPDGGLVLTNQTSGTKKPSYCITSGFTTYQGVWDTIAGLEVSGGLITGGSFSGSGASQALDNLASVAINTSLLSDTDVTDDLGSAAIRWKDAYLQTAGTGDTDADTFTLRTRDVDGAAWQAVLTITAGDTPTADLWASVTIGGAAIYRAGGTDVPVADGGTGASDASGARTNLGATTAGGNFFTLANPSAITFPRINADNTVDALDAATFRTAIGAGTGGGDFSGPASSTDNAIVRFDGTGGKTGQNSNATIADTTGVITAGGFIGPFLQLYDESGLGAQKLAVGVITNLSTDRALSLAVPNADTTLTITSTSTSIGGTNTGDDKTAVTGILKGNGSAISAATGGVDYVVPGGALGTPSSGTLTNCTGLPTAGLVDDAVTYAKIQNVSATDRLLGRDTAGAGNIEELTVSGGVEFTGSGIQRSALTGDVTASAGSNTTALAKKYACKMNRGAAQTITDDTYVKVLFDTEEYDTGSIGDLGNSRFVVPSGGAGKYHVEGSWWAAIGSSGNRVDAVIYKNGGQWKLGREWTNGVGDLLAAVSDDMDLADADVIEFYARHNKGSDVDTATGTETKARMSIFRIAVG